MHLDSRLPVFCSQCGALVTRMQCIGCGRTYAEPSVTWLPTDEETNILFNSIAVVLQNSLGHSLPEATDLAKRYYTSFTDASYCSSLGIPVQDDDFFHHEGAHGMALRTHYYLHLRRDPDPHKFIEWRTQFHSAPREA